MSVISFLTGKRLVKPALVDQGGPKFYDDDSSAMDAASDALAATPQEPALSMTQPQVIGVAAPDAGQPGAFPAGSMIARPPDQDAAPNLQFSGGQLNVTDPNESALPRYADPSFRERTTDQYGNVTRGPNAGLTKFGALMKVLAGAAQGTVDAAASGALNASPGKSYFGSGLQGAQEMPLIRAMRAQQAQRGQLENQQLQNQVDAYNMPVPVTTPDGQTTTLPFGRAKSILDIWKDQAQRDQAIASAKKDAYVTPRNGGVYNTQNGQYAPGTEPQDKQQVESPQQLYAATVKGAMNRGLTGDALANDPQVKGALAAFQAAQKEQKPDSLEQQYLDAASKGDRGTMGNIERAWHAKATNVHITNSQQTTIPEIKPGTAQYKVAQDIAYGKLPLSQFRSLVAYSRDAGTKLAIYQKAADLNPNFNPAQFEMGYKLASNPKVQQQLSSMDNVIEAVPDLLDASDAASRSGVQAVNKIVNWGGAQLGSKKYSNFHTAQIAFADELSGALGYGSATDMSRQMGLSLTDPNMTPQQFSSAIREVVVPFINRKRDSLLHQMGTYGQSDMNPAANAPRNEDEVRNGRNGGSQNSFDQTVKAHGGFSLN